nr:immunoglobulin heavy chain junction region [Macaca mulatta]MOV51003.1 immunoglobulin heavy chain junction region [Macaca mulatta]MOV51185.1 immunoglobulin heavy chain junction region [Macaca mulatta]MOV51291.1 immunoglobulin heavy chain junction region [Macaca mulatta]MOV51960.1 immunoglobulin heavy chain junction region [Macaca mulatta]
CNRGSYW